MKSNIILTGMPWSGKTTIWKLLAEHTGKYFLDFDDDVIESGDRPSVAEYLEQLWEERFLEMEKALIFTLDIENTILATSWSVALCHDAMEYLKENGSCIYIDVPTEIITTRLQNMKTGRIVWMQDGKTLKDILAERRESYEQSYDYRFLNNTNGSIEQVQEKFLAWYIEKLNRN